MSLRTVSCDKELMIIGIISPTEVVELVKTVITLTIIVGPFDH